MGRLRIPKSNEPKMANTLFNRSLRPPTAWDCAAANEPDRNSLPYTPYLFATEKREFHNFLLIAQLKHGFTTPTG